MQRDMTGRHAERHDREKCRETWQGDMTGRHDRET